MTKNEFRQALTSQSYNMKKLSRRDFNSTLTKGLGSFALLGSTTAACSQPTTAATVVNKDQKKLGIALVGLGSYSTHQLAPALLETDYCRLAAIVTGTPEKEQVWANKYQLPKEHIYNYNNFDTIINDTAVDIVYVVLPNSMHADFCIRAAKAGKHVICEKPMAINTEECQAIIDACEQANVKLSVGYRMQSEPYTQEVKRLVKEQTFGKVNYISVDAAYKNGGNWDQWRLDKKLSGGGALLNMGVYAIQGVIYGTGELPISVTAQEFSTRPDLFKDTDETITAQFEFPSGAVGSIMTSHNARGNRLYASCDKGWFELRPAHSYGPISGQRSDGEAFEFPHKSQQALQMDDFSKHILQGTPNMAPGSMGLRDMVIAEAIYASIAAGGKKMSLDLGAFAPAQ